MQSPLRGHPKGVPMAVPRMENEGYAVQETPNRKGRGWNFQEFPSFSLRYKAWLAESDSQALKYACRQLDNAFKKFFAKQGGYPNYKSRRDGRQGYTTTNAAHIHYLDRRVRIPKIGILKVRDSRRLPLGAKICYATVIRDHGIYFASITYKAEEEAPPATVSESAVLGLDYKSDGLYVDSNGVSAGMDHFYRKSQKALARQQRKLSGKVGARKGEKPSDSQGVRCGVRGNTQYAEHGQQRLRQREGHP